ncbi:MAG: ABC transporter permease subunit [Gemmatimonadetes bacterium]|nr:ABC transporter permease subunit [Gemmatimonadota bacterium]
MGGSLLEQLPLFLSYSNVSFLAQAFGVTVALSIVGCVVGYTVGALLAFIRNRHVVDVLPARFLSVGFSETFRRVPFLVKLMVVFFAFEVVGMRVSMFTVTATTVALAAAAFSAEIMRAGLEALPESQWDAAESMNMGGVMSLRLWALPQSWKVILSPALSFTVGLIKSTSIASQISVFELTYAAKVLNERGFSPVLSFGSLLVLYFLICYPLNLYARRLERQLERPRGWKSGAPLLAESEAA